MPKKRRPKKNQAFLVLRRSVMRKLKSTNVSLNGRTSNSALAVKLSELLGDKLTPELQTLAADIQAELEVNPNGAKRVSRNFIQGCADAGLIEKSVTDQAKDFLSSRAWKEKRYQALTQYGNKCMACGVKPEDGAVLHVDHIIPRSSRPDLSLELSNLQILCADCNWGKLNKDKTDWRIKPKTASSAQFRREKKSTEDLDQISVIGKLRQYIDSASIYSGKDWTVVCTDQEVRFIYDIVSQSEHISDYHLSDKQLRWAINLIHKISEFDPHPR